MPKLTPWDLYELCAQHPPRDAALLDAMYWMGFENQPPVPAEHPHLAEDFSGSAALSRAWTTRFPDRSATAIDLDPEALEFALARAARAGVAEAICFRCVNVMQADDQADLIFVGNFSICELHMRQQLVAYFQRARARLSPGGMIACDLYGGADAYTPTEMEQDHEIDGRPVLYTWEQREADVTTGMVENAMHFRVGDPDKPELVLTDAFEYRWRLWSIPELRDAMTEAGFARTEVYHRYDCAEDEDGRVYASPIIHGEELEDNYFVFVVGRA